jgi:diketogulonate reductase-like aldo/keto reductase
VQRGLVSRGDLFLQTKFTFRPGQDDRLPYDPKAPIPTQVEQSFASSLEHLGVERLDSYLLHGPLQRVGLTKDDWAAWKAMEAVAESGRVGMIGVSNFTIEQLRDLLEGSRIRPRFVQNRCYANRGWDREVRKFCRDNGIVYQGFSLLTANQALLARPEIMEIANRHHRTVAQIIFRFAIDLGILPLTGTTDTTHMKADLDVLDFHLETSEIERIERLSTP